MSQGVTIVRTMSNHAPTTSPSDTNLERRRRRALVNELPEPLRLVYRRVLIVSLSQGVPIDPNALVVILCVLDEICEDPLRFTVPLVEKLMWHEVALFCMTHSIEMPTGSSEALFAVLAIGHGDDTLNVELEDPQAIFETLGTLASTPV